MTCICLLCVVCGVLMFFVDRCVLFVVCCLLRVVLLLWFVACCELLFVEDRLLCVVVARCCLVWQVCDVWSRLCGVCRCLLWCVVVGGVL